MSNKGINLKINGRLFPTWVLANFRKFKLPEVFVPEGEDPCNIKTKLGLKKYQEFLGNYLTLKSPFKDILIYHGLGSGKTVSAINIYNVLFNFTPEWNVFLLIKASLKDEPWIKDLKNWLPKENYEERFNNIYFISYDSPIADKTFIEITRKVDSSKKSIYIIDEAHNFIRNVYGNITTKKGKRAQVIYDYIQRDKLENPETRIILLSATPVVNTPYELALIYNLMRPNLFPDNESTFQQIFYSTANSEMINPEKKNMFQRRIMGLTSYYIGATPDLYATKKIHYKDLIMPEYFEQVYNVFEEIEEKREKLMRKLSKGNVGNEMATYSSYTRQASNFVFPYINSTINGENRPRPGDFRIDEEEAYLLYEGKSEKKIKKLIQRETANKYLEEIKNFIKEFEKYLEDIKKRDKSSLEKDIKLFEEKYNKDFSKFEKEEQNKSLLYTTLYNSSPKMINIIFRILRSPGPTMVYSNYVSMEGLEILKIYLKQFGFGDYNKTKNNSSFDFKRYIEFHGSVEDKEIRTENKNIFNQTDNKDGKNIKIIMISPAGAEGINLANVRQVHLMEPYWNEGRIQQIIGRAIRQCSHKDLPIKERLVDVYRYKMIRNSKKLTTDQKMEDLARRKINLIESFLEAVREGAVDCGLFINHNMMGTKYNCFQFEQESVLSKNPGPAFKMDLDLDSKINNGLNAIGTKLKKLKVMKIKAVNKLEDEKYSEEQFFWYDKNSNVIYDYELHYPIGKILLDDNNIPIKIKKDVFLISYLIDIPTKLE